MMKKSILLISMACVLLGWSDAFSQTDITFRVNMTHLLDGEDFDSERDRIELIGNRHPLSAIQPLQMKQSENDPNLFILSVTFPQRLVNTPLEYQFRALIKGRYHNEDIPRTLRIPADNQTLDSLYFNSYAW